MRVLMIFVSLFFAVLSADLLYLFFVGGWCDPYPIIEYSEVVMLFLFMPLGIWCCYWNLKQLAKGGKTA